MFYTIYKTVNMVNGKEYVGFHSVKTLEDILCETSENGSIFYDGYLGSGKLMKRALKKYGPMNMRQELILVTEDQKEAEDLEEEIVCYEWVISTENYNMSIGGNVTILFGEHNGFFGKKHTEEVKEKMRRKKKEAYDKTPYSWSESFLVEDESVTFLNSNQIREYFGIAQDNWFEVNKLIFEGVVRYKSEYLQKAAIQRYLKRYNFLNDHEARAAAKERVKKLASERLKGIKKTAEERKRMSESAKAWIKENPEKHQERMLKINKNPDKIRKTAEKHRGMKRSEESKRKMSEAKKGKPANNKGKIYIHDIETGKRKYINKNDIIPEGWARGMGKRK